jgi:hypothetical protein
VFSELNSDFFFRLLNLFIVVFLFAFVFKHFVLQNIKNGVARVRDHFNALKGERNSIIKLQKDVVCEAEEQKDLMRTFDSNLKLWRHVFNSERDLEEKNFQRIREALIVKKTEQFKNLKMLQARDVIVPKVIEESEKEFIRDFADDNKKRAYLNDIIKFMKSI